MKRALAHSDMKVAFIMTGAVANTPWHLHSSHSQCIKRHNTGLDYIKMNYYICLANFNNNGHEDDTQK